MPGSLVSPTSGGAINWPPPSYDPQTGLFYVGLHQGYAMYYLTQTDMHLIMGLGGKEEDSVGAYPSSIIGIDYHTGKTVYNYVFPGGAGPRACSPRRGTCCSPVMAPAIWWPTMPAPRSRCGTRASGPCPTLPRLICWTGGSTS